MALLVKSRGVTPVSCPNSHHCLSSIMASSIKWMDNPHPLDWLYDSLSSPPVAGVWWAHTLDWLYDYLSSPPVSGVWWAHWHCCPVAAVASSKWMLHTGGGWGETPHMITKRFGCTTIHNKALYKCIIHSFNRMSKHNHKFVTIVCYKNAF